MKFKNFQKITKSSENKILNAYLLGLFRADGYTWTGTFGVTNRNSKILRKAANILSNFGEIKWKKDEKGLLRVYVSSRPRKRNFDKIMELTEKSLTNNKTMISSYFAGKYDGDGSYWKTRLKFKITYGNSKNIILTKNFYSLLVFQVKSEIIKTETRLTLKYQAVML